VATPRHAILAAPSPRAYPNFSFNDSFSTNQVLVVIKQNHTEVEFFAKFAYKSSYIKFNNCLISRIQNQSNFPYN